MLTIFWYGDNLWKTNFFQRGKGELMVLDLVEVIEEVFRFTSVSFLQGNLSNRELST